MSDRASDCTGPFLLPPVGTEHSGLKAAEVLASGLGESGLLCDDTSRSPAPWGREVGGFHSPSSPEEDSPKMNSVEKSYWPD